MLQINTRQRNARRAKWARDPRVAGRVQWQRFALGLGAAWLGAHASRSPSAVIRMVLVVLLRVTPLACSVGGRGHLSYPF